MWVGPRPLPELSPEAAAAQAQARFDRLFGLPQRKAARLRQEAEHGIAARVHNLLFDIIALERECGHGE